MVQWTTIDVDDIKSKTDYEEKIGLLATAAEEIAVSVATHEEVSHGAGEITESEDDDDDDEGQKLERKAARFEHKKEKLKARADKGKVDKLQKKMEKYQKKGACSVLAVLRLCSLHCPFWSGMCRAHSRQGEGEREVRRLHQVQNLQSGVHQVPDEDGHTHQQHEKVWAGVISRQATRHDSCLCLDADCPQRKRVRLSSSSSERRSRARCQSRPSMLMTAIFLVPNTLRLRHIR